MDINKQRFKICSRSFDIREGDTLLHAVTDEIMRNVQQEADKLCQEVENHT